MSKNLNLLTNRDMDVKTVTFFNSRDINLEKNYFFSLFDGYPTVQFFEWKYST